MKKIYSQGPILNLDNSCSKFGFDLYFDVLVLLYFDEVLIEIKHMNRKGHKLWLHLPCVRVKYWWWKGAQRRNKDFFLQMEINVGVCLCLFWRPKRVGQFSWGKWKTFGGAVIIKSNPPTLLIFSEVWL